MELKNGPGVWILKDPSSGSDNPDEQVEYLHSWEIDPWGGIDDEVWLEDQRLAHRFDDRNMAAKMATSCGRDGVRVVRLTSNRLVSENADGVFYVRHVVGGAPVLALHRRDGVSITWPCPPELAARRAPAEPCGATDQDLYANLMREHDAWAGIAQGAQCELEAVRRDTVALRAIAEEAQCVLESADRENVPLPMRGPLRRLEQALIAAGLRAAVEEEQ